MPPIPRVAIVQPPPMPIPSGGGGESIGNKAFGLGMIWDLANRIRAVAGDFFPSFEAAITVRVVGGPDSDIRRIWYLALSAAFGRFRNRVRDGATSYAYQGTWDVTNKWCQVEIAYQTSAWIQGGWGKTKPVAFEDYEGTIRPGLPGPGGVFRAVFAVPGGSAQNFIQRGPEQLTVGASLPHWLQGRTVRVRPKRVSNYFPMGDAVPCPAPPGPAGATGAAAAAVAGVPGAVGIAGAVAAPRRVGVYSSARNAPGSVLREWPYGNRLFGGFFTGFPYAVKVVVGEDGGAKSAHTSFSMLNEHGDITLPDDGRVITTAEKTDPLVQPPQPSLDGSSRSSLVALVAQALTSPCVLPPSPPCTRVLRGPTEKTVYFPGSLDWDDVVQVSRAIQEDAVPDSTPRTVPAGLERVGPARTVDGYPAFQGMPNLKER